MNAGAMAASLPMLPMAEGGAVGAPPKYMADGGATLPPPPFSSGFGSFVNSVMAPSLNYDVGNPSGLAPASSSTKGNEIDYPEAKPEAGPTGGKAAAAADAGIGGSHPTAFAFARGGPVPAMLSPGEKYLSPDKVDKVANGADPLSEGKKVPGKPKVAGAKNDYANDTVKATLQEGGIVLPRSVTQSKNPHWAAKKFVESVMAKQGLKPRLKK